MDTDKIREIILKVNGKAAEENLKSIMRTISDAKAKINKLNKEIGPTGMTREQSAQFEKSRKEIIEVEKKLRRYGSTADEVKRIMDSLSGSTLKELKQNLNTLNKALSSGTVKRNSEE